MKPDFSGEYVLDRNASALGPAASGIMTARMSIVHDDPRFRCSARFASADDAMEFSFERSTDGDVTTGPLLVSRCYWEDNTLVFEDPLQLGAAMAVMTWRYELTAGGQRLRATERIRGGGRDQDNVWEFERV
jgi:hypothetical protein